jgi:hypothetical protein
VPLAVGRREATAPRARDGDGSEEHIPVRTILRFGALAAVAMTAAVAGWTLSVRPVQAPEPGVLDAMLGTTQGTSVNAIYIVSGLTTRAYRFPTTPTATGCTKVVVTGLPCAAGATPLTPGTTVTGYVQKNVSSAGGYAYCSCKIY